MRAVRPPSHSCRDARDTTHARSWHPGRAQSVLTTTMMENHQVSALEEPAVSMGNRCMAGRPPKRTQNGAVQTQTLSWSSRPEMNSWSKGTAKEGRAGRGDAREDVMAGAGGGGGTEDLEG